MKTLEEQMATYAAHRGDARSKATRFVGVPLIAVSLTIALVSLLCLRLQARAASCGARARAALGREPLTRS